jgi:dCTP deaminase
VIPIVLSDVEILEAIKKGEIQIIPFVRDNVGPCSVDLTLSSEFRLFEGKRVIDPRLVAGNITTTVDTGKRPFVIQPGQFVLAKTRERIAISRGIAATLEGRSSIARLGLVVHAAGLVNPGSGLKVPVPQILEIFCRNNSPVKLYPGMKIVQIIFHRLSIPASRGYDEIPSSKFVGQK